MLPCIWWHDIDYITCMVSKRVAPPPTSSPFLYMQNKKISEISAFLSNLNKTKQSMILQHWFQTSTSSIKWFGIYYVSHERESKPFGLGSPLRLPFLESDQHKRFTVRTRSFELFGSSFVAAIVSFLSHISCSALPSQATWTTHDCRTNSCKCHSHIWNVWFLSFIIDFGNALIRSLQSEFIRWMKSFMLFSLETI